MACYFMGGRPIVAASVESEHGDRKGSPLRYTLRPPRHTSRSGYSSAPAMRRNDAHPYFMLWRVCLYKVKGLCRSVDCFLFAGVGMY
jgi:hypothetical protein